MRLEVKLMGTLEAQVKNTRKEHWKPPGDAGNFQVLDLDLDLKIGSIYENSSSYTHDLCPF